MFATCLASTHAPRATWVSASLALVVLAVTLAFPPSGAIAIAAGVSTHPASQEAAQDWFLVVDRASILDDRQERSAVDDAFRLSQLGIPVQVWTENTGFNQEQSDFRANELRIANRIESAPYRDDGLLIYLSVDPRDESAVTISFSVGSRTLPNGGLTLGTLATIREAIAIPQIKDDHPARAIVYSIRELIYQQMFTPPPLEPISSTRQQFGTILSIAVPLLALALAGWILAWRRHAFWWIPLVVGAATATLLAILAMVSHSEVGMASALLLGVLVTWQAIRHDRGAPKGNARQLRVTPRPPTPGRNPRAVIR